MITQTILKPIWNGQITIPQAWRKLLWVDGKHVKATLWHNKIIIESLEPEVVERDIKKIQLNELNQETINAIKESEKQYKAWNKDAFLSHDEFWGDV